MEKKLSVCRDYEDIIELPRHVSKTHPPMPVSERAAQFSPFAALTGYDDAVREMGRQTKERIELNEDVKQDLNEKLLMLKELLEGNQKTPNISITYFVPDERKSGGSYVTASGAVKKLDEYRRIVVMEDGNTIPVDEIAGIDMV